MVSGIVLLASLSVDAWPATAALVELAGCVGLLLLLTRLWRSANGGARCIAGFLTLLNPPSVLFPDGWGVSWFTFVYASALLAVSVGLWHAERWARWTAGAASILAFVRLLLMWTGVYPQGWQPSPMLPGSSFLLTFFTLFWAANALYLFLPSTGESFALRRATHGGGR
jgi:hypothetical protein